jgi:hypothetical protein
MAIVPRIRGAIIMSDRKYRIVALHECEIRMDEVYEPDEDWLRDMEPLPVPADLEQADKEEQYESI